MTHSSRQARRIYLTIIVLVAFIALILGLYFSQLSHTKKPDLSKFNGTLLTTPRQIDDFSLAGTSDKNYTKASLQGHWTFMFFGYTQCPKLCPVTMSELANMYKQLESDNVQDLPEVVLISLDPERDTVQKMKQYVTAFNPHFVGAVGESAQIDKMTKEMGIAYMKVNNGNNAADYMIQHSGTIILFNPQGDIAAYFSLPHDPSKMAKDYEMLVS